METCGGDKQKQLSHYEVNVYRVECRQRIFLCIIFILQTNLVPNCGQFYLLPISIGAQAHTLDAQLPDEHQALVMQVAPLERARKHLPPKKQ